MVFSLGRTLYNLAAGRVPAVDVRRPARPSGDVIWLHAPSAAAVVGLTSLARRIESEVQAKVLLTCPEDVALPPQQLRDSAPFDRPAEVRSFLQHW